MATQISNYKCPACTAPLHYSSGSGFLECDYCGSKFSVAEVDALYAEKDAKAADAFTNAENKPEKAQKPGNKKNSWDTSSLTESWGTDEEKMRAYNCPSCGAELICEETTAATSCPYCGNPTLIPGQFGNTLRPDYVIPFQLDKQAAVTALKRHYRKKLLLPRKFSDNNQVQKIQGIYVPFWLFDATVDISCKFDGIKTREYRKRDKIITKMKHHDSLRAGSIRFEKVPTDASQKMPDDLMDSLLPYQYDGLVPFSMAYFPGYLADKYDVTIESCARRIDRQCASSAEDAMRQDAMRTGHYSSVRTVSRNMTAHRGRVWYALMPVWLLNTEWNGQNFVFAMNGQTGKLVGDLPISKPKERVMFGILTVLFSLLFYLMASLGGT